MFIGNQPGSEKIQDHKSYAGDGIRKFFAVAYQGNNVLVFLNGIKLKEGIDYHIEPTGAYVEFTLAPEIADSIDLYGASEVTDLSRSTYSKETFTAGAGQTMFQLLGQIAGGERINVYLNGLRLAESDYEIDYINKNITISPRLEGDIIFVEILQHGFRSSMHNAKNEKALHPMFATPSKVTQNILVPEGENAMLVGPIDLEGVIEVNGTLTIV